MSMGKAVRGWGEVSQGRMAEKREEVGRATACRNSWSTVEFGLYLSMSGELEVTLSDFFLKDTLKTD